MAMLRQQVAITPPPSEGVSSVALPNISFKCHDSECLAGKVPKLPVEYQRNSTRHFMRELNRLGVTGVIDAGGGHQTYQEDYQVIE